MTQTRSPRRAPLPPLLRVRFSSLSPVPLALPFFYFFTTIQRFRRPASPISSATPRSPTSLRRPSRSSTAAPPAIVWDPCRNDQVQTRAPSRRGPAPPAPVPPGELQPEDPSSVNLWYPCRTGQLQTRDPSRRGPALPAPAPPRRAADVRARRPGDSLQPPCRVLDSTTSGRLGETVRRWSLLYAWLLHLQRACTDDHSAAADLTAEFPLRSYSATRLTLTRPSRPPRSSASASCSTTPSSSLPSQRRWLRLYWIPWCS
ncbi:hypothetical protein PVAP13_8KG107900 [Panicum virgatum]|uniref:Uncharacterized protein n=1 Tax=Panicum virgatum TaxID=38727 RepID=A0A8T0PGM2_PANVG|nr:hypothetical protein PVAP13_8KG107900 [Panicum virgatum]